MTRSAPLRVLVADDHPVVREGLVTLIDRQSDMQVVAEAGNGRDAVEQFFTHRPDIGLFDLRMPVMGGIETIVAICEKAKGPRLIILTTYQSEEDIYRALQAGALGYVLKTAPVGELIACIHAVGEGKTWVPPDVGAKLANRVATQQLTPREMEVLQAMAIGKSNKEIGALLNISEATVKVHMTHILEKLRVSGRTAAISVAVKRGLIQLDKANAAS
jgi:two-component system NarL family response regulator